MDDPMAQMIMARIDRMEASVIHQMDRIADRLNDHIVDDQKVHQVVASNKSRLDAVRQILIWAGSLIAGLVAATVSWAFGLFTK